MSVGLALCSLRMLQDEFKKMMETVNKQEKTISELHAELVKLRNKYEPQHDEEEKSLQKFRDAFLKAVEDALGTWGLSLRPDDKTRPWTDRLPTHELGREAINAVWREIRFLAHTDDVNWYWRYIRDRTDVHLDIPDDDNE